MMLEDALGETIRPRRFSAWLFSAFGASALVIVGTGILGLVAMTTRRRRREIGIRIALGATRGQLVRQIVRELAIAIAIGLATGSLIAAWLVRYVETYLYKTPLYDPIAWAGAVAVLLMVVGTGALVPAARASRVDPVRTLRVE
jgi:ABC-type antimicrobial peptide transport system permease subunit